MLRFYHPLDFMQHRLQIWSIRGDDIILPGMFMMRRRQQIGKMIRIVVTKNHLPLRTLEMVCVTDPLNVWFGGNKFSEVEVATVFEKYIASQISFGRSTLLSMNILRFNSR